MITIHLESMSIYILIEGRGIPNFSTTVSLIHLNDHNINILYDTGFPYDSKKLMEALQQIQISPDEINYIIFSHWHIDHCGSIHLFKNAKLIVSLEFFYTVSYIMNAVSQVETSEEPIELLAEILRKHLLEEQMMELTPHFLSQTRSMANLIYRHSSLYKEIMRKNHFGDVIYLSGKKEVFFNQLTLLQCASHTKGDIYIHICQSERNIFLVGDIISSESYDIAKPPHLSEDTTEYFSTIHFICKPKAYIVPGHGRPFICTYRGNL